MVLVNRGTIQADVAGSPEEAAGHDRRVVAFPQAAAEGLYVAPEEAREGDHAPSAGEQARSGRAARKALAPSAL